MKTEQIEIIFAIGDKNMNDMLNAADLNDGGTKLFGNVVSATTEKMGDVAKLREQIEEEYDLAFLVIDRKMVYHNEKYLTFSDGTKFFAIEEWAKKMNFTED